MDAGEIGSGHAVTAIYEIKTPESRARLMDESRYGTTPPAEISAAASEEYAFVKIRYKLPNARYQHADHATRHRRGRARRSRSGRRRAALRGGRRGLRPDPQGRHLHRAVHVRRRHPSRPGREGRRSLRLPRRVREPRQARQGRARHVAFSLTTTHANQAAGAVMFEAFRKHLGPGCFFRSADGTRLIASII